MAWRLVGKLKMKCSAYDRLKFWGIVAGDLLGGFLVAWAIHTLFF